MIEVLRTRAGARSIAIAAFVLTVEWTRSLIATKPYAALPALLIGGGALLISARGFRPSEVGLGTSRLPWRILGGAALAVVLLLPAAVRIGPFPQQSTGLAAAAVLVSVGEEVAFRGALYTALDQAGGAPLAVLGSTLVWTLAHALSHPPAFLGAVAMAGLVLALWRWACRDLVAPIAGHVIADLAL